MCMHWYMLQHRCDASCCTSSEPGCTRSVAASSAAGQQRNDRSQPVTAFTPVEEVLLGVAVAELQQRVSRGQRQHVRRHRRAGPQEHHPALVLPQRRVPAQPLRCASHTAAPTQLLACHKLTDAIRSTHVHTDYHFPYTRRPSLVRRTHASCIPQAEDQAAPESEGSRQAC